MNRAIAIVSQGTLSMAKSSARFRLRTALLALTCLCVVVGAVVSNWFRLEAEHEAAKALRAIEFKDWQEPPRWTGSGPFPPVGVWTRQKNYIGVELPQPVRFSDVIAVWRSPDRVQITSAYQRLSNEDLQRFNAFRRLVVLILSDVNLTDARFGLLKSTGYLETLQVDKNPLHDESVQTIGSMYQLKSLNLSQTLVTDAAMPSLSGLPKLQFLHLVDCALTDRGMAGLKDCPALISLTLNYTAITDAGLAEICKIKTLSYLSLAGTAITDEGLACLANLTRLESIDLTDTRVTTRAISILEKLPQLQSAYLSGLDVDWEAAEEFQNELRARIRKRAQSSN